MITNILVLKERLKVIYAKYDIYIHSIIKLVIAMITFFSINSYIGYMSKLKNPVIILILSLFCSFLPVNAILIIAAALISFHLLALSLEVGAIAVGLVLVMAVFYFRFAPKDGYVLLLTPLAFVFKIPCAAPLIMGLIGGPLSAVPVACGVIIYYFLRFVKNNATSFVNQDTVAATEKINYILDSMLGNKSMLLVLAAVTLVLLAVYGIRKLSVDHSWIIAIAAGGVIYIVFVLIGEFMLGISESVLWLLFGTILSMGIGLVLQFFAFSVDYSATERVQFEDDDYFYYVKAVPKIKITVPQKKVKRINPRDEEEDQKEAEQEAVPETKPEAPKADAGGSEKKQQ